MITVIVVLGLCVVVSGADLLLGLLSTLPRPRSRTVAAVVVLVVVALALAVVAALLWGR